jgi:RNase adaptor protein for sRNA GlmZ degradation
LDKAELIKTNMIILNKSKSNLTEGFNEAIYESDLKNDQEINEALKRKSSQLEQIEQKCISKMNEYKIKIEDINKNTKEIYFSIEFSEIAEMQLTFNSFKVKSSGRSNQLSLYTKKTNIASND